MTATAKSRYGELRHRVLQALPEIHKAHPEGFTRLDVQRFLEGTYRGKVLPGSISNELALQCDQGILIKRGTGVYTLVTEIRPIGSHDDTVERKLDQLIAAVGDLAAMIKRK